MIQHYRFGKPFRTDAVVREVPLGEKGAAPRFEVQGNGKEFVFRMKPEDIVYGLGETVRGINKRGWAYVSNCTDDGLHTEGKHSLYGAHNFLIVAGRAGAFGAFFDYPGKIRFDVGCADPELLRVSPEEPNLDVYVIEGKDPPEIAREFRGLVGRSYIPPKWAFGYGQSRYSYMDEDEVREVVRRHREAGVPLDSVYLDIDYMDRYKDFTVNEKTFPDFPAFVREMREQHIHLVPIIDAGVKIEKGYRTYDEGVKGGYFCKKADGSDFVGAVWPGKVHFPDVLNPRARAWFGGQYGALLDAGIDGFWNDMNEPALFYSEDRLAAALGEIRKLAEKEAGPAEAERLKELARGLANAPEDYASFYHRPAEGGPVRHDRVHNLYGYNMTRAAAEAFRKLAPGKRILLFSRSSYIGMHRYGGIWTGDNCSWWAHLLLEIHMMPSLNLCGFLYSGADIGGFGDDTTEDLMLRWLAFGIFTPLMRNHSAKGTRRQEFYRFRNRAAFRNLIGLRYALLPYLYSEYMKAALKDGLYFRPLAFDYPEDPHAAEVGDQLLLGGSVMLAPVYTQNASGRTVYLPERMKLVRMKSADDVTEEIAEPGFRYIPVAPDEAAFFIRPGKLVPLSRGGQSVEDVDFRSLRLLGYVRDKAEYEYYDDDGNGTDYENPEHWAAIAMDAAGNVETRGGMKLHASAF